MKTLLTHTHRRTRASTSWAPRAHHAALRHTATLKLSKKDASFKAPKTNCVSPEKFLRAAVYKSVEVIGRAKSPAYISLKRVYPGKYEIRAPIAILRPGKYHGARVYITEEGGGERRGWTDPRGQLCDIKSGLARWVWYIYMADAPYVVFRRWLRFYFLPDSPGALIWE